MEEGITSDLLKIYYTMEAVKGYLANRDHMNAKMHMAKETIYSPLTSEVFRCVVRLEKLLGDHLPSPQSK